MSNNLRIINAFPQVVEPISLSLARVQPKLDVEVTKRLRLVLVTVLSDQAQTQELVACALDVEFCDLCGPTTLSVPVRDGLCTEALRLCLQENEGWTDLCLSFTPCDGLQDIHLQCALFTAVTICLHLFYFYSKLKSINKNY